MTETTQVHDPAAVVEPGGGAGAPVRETASGDAWTGGELTGVKALLLTQLGEMRAEYQHSLAALEDLKSRNTDGAGDDQADAGAKTFDREQELSIAANRLDLIAQITRAVERIDKGAYGLCEACGEPIPKLRLEAFPMATLDVVCKQREERR